jgi:hypothetical protein
MHELSLTSGKAPAAHQRWIHASPQRHSITACLLYLRLTLMSQAALLSVREPTSLGPLSTEATYSPSEKSNGSGPSSLSSLTSLKDEAEVCDLHAMTAPGVPHVEKSGPSHILSPEHAAGLEDISVNVNTPLKPLNAAAGIGLQSSLESTPSNRGTAALSHFIEETTYVPLQPSLTGPAHFPAQR